MASFVSNLSLVSILLRCVLLSEHLINVRPCLFFILFFISEKSQNVIALFFITIELLSTCFLKTAFIQQSKHYILPFLIHQVRLSNFHYL